MGSPAFNAKHGKFTGNGGASDVVIKTGFQPRFIEIYSAEGLVKWIDRGPGPFADDGGAQSILSSGLAVDEEGFTVSGSADVLNKDTVEYAWRAY